MTIFPLSHQCHIRGIKQATDDIIIIDNDTYFYVHNGLEMQSYFSAPRRALKNACWHKSRWEIEALQMCRAGLTLTAFQMQSAASKRLSNQTPYSHSVLVTLQPWLMFIFFNTIEFEFYRPIILSYHRKTLKYRLKLFSFLATVFVKDNKRKQ